MSLGFRLRAMGRFWAPHHGADPGCARPRTGDLREPLTCVRLEPQAAMWARGGRPDPCLGFPSRGTVCEPDAAVEGGPCGAAGVADSSQMGCPRGAGWRGNSSWLEPGQVGCREGGRTSPGGQHRPPPPEGSVAPLSAPRSPAPGQARRLPGNRLRHDLSPRHPPRAATGLGPVPRPG